MPNSKDIRTLLQRPTKETTEHIQRGKAIAFFASLVAIAALTYCVGADVGHINEDVLTQNAPFFGELTQGDYMKTLDALLVGGAIYNGAVDFGQSIVNAWRTRREKKDERSI